MDSINLVRMRNVINTLIGLERVQGLWSMVLDLPPPPVRRNVLTYDCFDDDFPRLRIWMTTRRIRVLPSTFQILCIAPVAKS